MKALAIVSLVFSGLSIFIPVGGVFIAMLCSLFALISFRAQSTLAGITFGINIINTMFLSPSIMFSPSIIIMFSDIASSGALDSDTLGTGAPTGSGEVYWFYVGFHLVLFAIALIWRVVRGAPKTDLSTTA